MLPLAGLVDAASAQPASAEAQLSDDADTLADTMLAKIAGPTVVHNLITASRPSVLQLIEKSGPTKEQAEEIWEKYMAPELEAQTPKLMARLHAILIEDFTVPELQAAVGNINSAARHSAAAKVPRMQQQFQEAGADWGRQAGNDAYRKHRDEIVKLGVKESGEP